MCDDETIWDVNECGILGNQSDAGQEITVIGALTDEGVEHFTVFKVTLHVPGGLLWAHQLMIECLSVCVGW